MLPLNGNKTHPLSDFARGVLRDLASAPKPRQEINAGVVDRLMRESLVEIVDLPSPYKSHKGGACAHLKITDAGRVAAR